ncbi:Uncharacterised protein [Mycobacteroides abscessus subsp. abscessus]|nr:Uncharacterised protein [Mycobacteroides abscessus subsp. abscessus]
MAIPVSPRSRCTVHWPHCMDVQSSPDARRVDASTSSILLPAAYISCPLPPIVAARDEHNMTRQESVRGTVSRTFEIPMTLARNAS